MQIAIEEIAIGARKRKPVEEKIRALAESIQEVGLINPVTVTEEHALVAGWHRLEACKLLGWKTITCEVKLLDALDAELLEIDENLIRNDLNALEQDLAIARRKEIYELKHPETKHGGDRKSEERKSSEHHAHLITSSFAEDTATKTGTSRHTVQRQAKVGQALRDIADEVAKTSIADNQKELLALSRLPEAERPAVVAALAGGTAKSVRQATREVKATTMREQHAVMPTGKYRIVYADPPWSYGNNQPDYYTEQRDHYPVMSLQDIGDLPIRDLAEDNAVLFLWVTSPMLEESFTVVKAWGFQYKTSFVWDKVKHNMGHYNSVRHELLLVCTRGACTPDVKKLFDSVVTEERTTHSKKPILFYEMIEQLYTYGRRLELFARTKREGWDTYGNE